MELCATTWAIIAFGLLIAIMASFIAGGFMAIAEAGAKTLLAWLGVMILIGAAELYASDALRHAPACEVQSHG